MPDLSLHRLVRPEDSKRVDVRIGSKASAEMKNRIDCLSLEVLKEVFNRIPKASVLHLVFCNCVQQTCFASNAQVNWTEYQRQNGLEDLNVLKLERDGDALLLKPLSSSDSMPLVPADHVRRLVIVLPLYKLF